MSAFGGKADMDLALRMSASDPKRTRELAQGSNDLAQKRTCNTAAVPGARDEQCLLVQSAVRQLS